MPGQQIDQPNPPALPSQLPDSMLDLAVSLDIKDALSEKEKAAVRKFRRAADYIATAMIFLRSNILLKEDLKPEHIKPRLLGHWGTCPGLTLIDSSLNLYLTKTVPHDPTLDFLFIIGPGHGAPGLLSSLWLEGSIEKFYANEYPRTITGLENLVRGFSTPGGFPSHVNSETPGAIHEGGELGYALGVAFGSVLDNPDLVSVVVIGDGEAETAATAASWHFYKFLDPRESGAVLPIIHLNGFKISERTIPGTMDDKELLALYSGYGYQVRIVEDLEDIDSDLFASITWAMREIRSIQKDARNGKAQIKPRWPLLILKTPKGWGGPKSLDGELVEGNFHSHQVPLPKVASDEKQMGKLKEWLQGYKIQELIDFETGKLDDDILSLIPPRPMGSIKQAYNARTPLKIPDWKTHGATGVDNHTKANNWNETNKSGDGERPQVSSMKKLGEFLAEIIKENPTTFRLFSPDELVSNKLDSALKVTGRSMQWDEFSRDKGGRIIEVLSEHICQALMQGYALTGRTALFPSYESFLGIVHTMMVQYSKFIKMARETKWRTPVPSINYLETSTWARQEHNGFSHQNPSFIGAVLNLKEANARVYLPPDANCVLSTMAHCLRSTNYVNLVVGSKQPTPVWLSPDEAEKHCIAGASIWEFASTDHGLNPDVVLCGIGTEVTYEVIAAAALLRRRLPEIRVRVVNVTDLMVLGVPGGHPHALSDDDFEALFTEDRDVVFNYHGYAVELKGLLFGRKRTERFIIEGYREEGSTTTPFDMLLRNNVSRYHVAIAAIRAAGRVNPKVELEQTVAVSELEHTIVKHQQYIVEHGKDPEGTYDTPTFD